MEGRNGGGYRDRNQGGALGASAPLHHFSCVPHPQRQFNSKTIERSVINIIMFLLTSGYHHDLSFTKHLS